MFRDEEDGEEEDEEIINLNIFNFQDIQIENLQKFIAEETEIENVFCFFLELFSYCQRVGFKFEKTCEKNLIQFVLENLDKIMKDSGEEDNEEVNKESFHRDKY